MTLRNCRFLLGMAGQILKYRLHHLLPLELLNSRRLILMIKLLQRLLPSRGNLPEQLTDALISRGPVYIKLGQLLSTRPDMLGENICQSLAKLQDQVDPLPGKEAIAIIERSLGQSSLSAFQSIDPEPIASASIAQVHGAFLTRGESVVIKIVRPGIEKRIRSEMQALIEMSLWLESRIPLIRQIHLTQILEDQLTVLLAELSMFREARNQIKLRRNFVDSPLLYVPRLHDRFTRQNLLVMERIDAPSISELERMRHAGVDFKALAHKGVETFFTQVFEDNFFHADMHPGNVFVDISSPSDPRWIALDCAIVGSLSESDQSYLAQNLIAFFARDYRQIVTLHLRSGWVPATTDAGAFESVIRNVCESIDAKPLGEINFAAFMTELLETAREFGMEVQPQLVLLQKTLLYVEGLGRQLYPQLDLWETAEPFMRRWAVKHLGPAAVLGKLLESTPKLLAELHRLPELLDDTQTIELRKQLAMQQNNLEQLQDQVQDQRRRTKRLSFYIAILLSAIVTALWLG